MLKREWDAESNGMLPHLFIPSKTSTLVPEFAVEYIRLGRTPNLVPEFAISYLVKFSRQFFLSLIVSFSIIKIH